ncbi:hypothetical protein [Calothrix sp. 336/3]|uniref:hypothetical protein n=1 Tax=Calothrix sp. 336/3 TaxID=1337936 RepID=UPI0004E328F7|nr:hypothetical protein [Calothrix sp. 336/3]AKG21275.1 hypothetical protein IJ00_08150 [Calothrix sp. 336/3]AKG21787.1 hypothetical protein IJ00_11440 [Calothrix sp. 336/3]
MPLPNGFSEFEHLQDSIRREHNKAVRAYFKNQADNDISTPKASLKHACLIKDDDSGIMMQQRQWLFEVVVGRLQSVQRPVYGIPVQEYQPDRRFKPQVKLYFLEPWDTVTHATNKVPQAEGEITFRLMNETQETISRAKAEQLARAIKQEIATPALIWEKGWFKATYQDLERGYDLRLFVKNKAEGERVVRKVLSIQNHTFDRDNFQFVEHDRTYSTNPGTHRVYGRQVNKPIRRRRVDVRFRYAQLLIWGQHHPVNLVAFGSTRLRSVIERV